MQVMGMAADMRGAGAPGFNAVTELLAARELIAARGIPGAPGSAENIAGADEKAAILRDVDAARAGANRPSGLDPITWAERQVQARLAPLLQ